jgi:trans-aconitate methyltransferase
MGFFDDIGNVRAYIDMARGYDGRALIARLRPHLAPGTTVLELGMGPGVDLDLLSATYTVTGSDTSDVFLDLYRETHPDADLLHLDAVKIATERRFDCVFSNKVLHHLERDDLSRSFARQLEVLNERGIACHSFWRGNGEEHYEGMRFMSWPEDGLRAMVEPPWEIIHLGVYTEMDDNDSILLIARTR